VTTTQAPPRHLTLLSVVIAGVVVLLDQLTKRWAVNALANGRTVDVVGSLRFNLTHNSGMAFSRGTGVGPVIGVVALVVVVVLLASLRRNGSVVSTVGLGLVIGGAIGNVLDRLFRSGEGFLGGAVVDFIDLQWWPVFNVADAAITTGGVILVVGSLFGGRRAQAGG
jgi:signal peptidase II